MQIKLYLSLIIELLHQAKEVGFTVSSLHIEWIWVPNITAVKVRNRKPSRHKKTIRITVTGGEKSLHSVKRINLVMKKSHQEHMQIAIPEQCVSSSIQSDNICLYLFYSG